MSAYDYLSKWFESDEVIAALGYYVQGSGTNASMKSPATAFTLIRPMVRDHTTPAGPGGFVRGGMGGLTNSIARSGMAHGLQIRTEVEVGRILTDNGGATGVELVNGEVVQGKCVIANAHAKTTFLKLLPEQALPEDFLRNVRNIRTRSTVFKVHLGVTALPQYTSFSPERCGFPYPLSVRFGDSVAYLEKAFDDVKRGDVSEEPFLAVMVPSLRDETLAPKGMHLVSVFGGHVVYEPDEARPVALRAKVLEKVLSLLERHAPGFRQHVVHTEVLTPRDLELRFDLHGGHVHHGDLTVDQAFFRRPVGGFADYRTPVKRLYLASSSAHPGGGVTGVPGYNAAREILKDLKH
jgi:phytoene dehydrogenase-like protein